MATKMPELRVRRGASRASQKLTSRNAEEVVKGFESQDWSEERWTVEVMIGSLHLMTFNLFKWKHGIDP